MTILEASNKLLEWFSTHEIFDLDEDFLSICKITINKDYDRAAFQLALRDFVSNNIVGNINNIYILKKPLEMYSQSIEINYQTSLAIATINNHFANLFKVKDEICEAKSLKTKDLINLITICQFLIEKSVKKEESNGENGKEK